MNRVFIGEWDEKYSSSEPTKFQSVCNPVIQHRIDSCLPPFEPMENCIEKTKNERVVLQTTVEKITKMEFNYRNVPWFDYNPEAVRLFKQRWRNYIKPGFNINVGNTFQNYDLAARDPQQRKQVVTTPVLGNYPHTQ